MDQARLTPFSICVLIASCSPGADTFVASTPCEQFCVDLSDRIESEATTSLAEKGSNPDCTTETFALLGCATECEDAAPSQACMDCEAASGNGCRQHCMGTSLGDTSFFIAEGLACWYGGSRPAEMCSDATTTTVRGQLKNPGVNVEIDYVGSATVAALSPLSLGLPDGRTVAIESPAATTGLAVGDSVQFEAQGYCPWWCASAYVIRSSTGVLLQAGWSGRKPLPLPEFQLDYELTTCVGTLRDGLRAIDLSLMVNGDEVLVGGRLEKQGYRLHNGASAEPYAIWVSDTPSIWYEGLIEAL